MKTFKESIMAYTGNQNQSLIKHLTAAGITDWSDLTKSNLAEFHDVLVNSVSPGSAKTYMATFKAFLARFDEDVNIPCKNYKDVLKSKNDKALKTFLDEEDLELFRKVRATTNTECFVKDNFLIGAFTGMRFSDITRVSKENISEGMITYVSQKTRITSTVPCSDDMSRRIERARRMKEICLVSYNRTLRRLCQRAGINKKVKVYKAGQEYTGEKWQFVSSHTARISFATNLSRRGVPIIDISRMLGHSSITMTERYIVPTTVVLSSTAMEYFK